MMDKPCFTALQIRNVIEGKCSYDRIPMMYHFWTYPYVFGEREAQIRALMDAYPYDIEDIPFNMPDTIHAPKDDPTYRWFQIDKVKEHHGGIDSNVILEDFDDLDALLEKFPDPNYVNLFPYKPSCNNKYKLGRWWYFFFERYWSFRGMENALMDFYLYPDEVHKIFRKLCDFYLRVIERAHDELHLDGIFTSDDIGTQKSEFFSEDIFVEFFKPYYKEIIDKCHSLGMHFWLHTCGRVQKFIPHLIEIGLDVLHPIQKYTMDEKEISELFGDKICIWAGFNVQQTIPYGTPEEVREEVRFLVDTYIRTDGRLMLTCGNGLTEDCTVASYEALLDETYYYSQKKMKELKGN